MANTFEKIPYNLEIPFVGFSPGQFIKSEQFNDDFNEIQDKINEIIRKFNLSLTHVEDYNNPHKVTAEQIGTYTQDDIDGFLYDIKMGELFEGVIGNELLKENSVDNRVLAPGAVNIDNIDESVGIQLDISKNTEITNRYTKEEIDKKLGGEDTSYYSKEQIDEKLSELQMGQIVDQAIGVEKLKKDVGEKLDIHLNPEITNRYNIQEVNQLVNTRGLPKDWGDLSDLLDGYNMGDVPLTDFATVGVFKPALTVILDLAIKEVIDARGSFTSLSRKLADIETRIGQGGGGDGSSTPTISAELSYDRDAKKISFAQGTTKNKIEYNSTTKKLIIS